MLATFDRALVSVNRWAVIAMLAAMAAMVFANVALRFLTDHSILWVEEVSRFLMIWLTFLGAGIVLRYGAHVAIDTLAQKLPGAAPALRGAVVAVLLGFFAAMVWLGTRYATLTWDQTTPVLGIPFGAVYLAMPIGFALMIVHLALMAREYVRERALPGGAGVRRRYGGPLIATLFIGCIALLVLGVPVAFALGGATLAAIVAAGLPLIALPKYLFSGIDIFALMAVPFFILTAEIMTGGALSEVLLRFASQFVGRFRGGLGHTNILAITFFSGISGSALADAAGPGAIMIRMMKRDGYRAEYAAALTAAVSILGPIIPPSITMIVYALAYPNVNLVGLMIAGVVPGIVIALAMAVINHRVSVRRDYRGVPESLAPRDYLRNTVRALPALVLPVLILGGIASGAFTPTEASVVAVFYSLAAGRWIYGSLEWRMLPAILLRSALMSASVLIIVAMSAAFAWVLTVSRVPQQMSEFIIGASMSPLAFLFAVNALLLVFGIFIEPLPGVVVLVPILAPIAHALGVNDLQFGIIVIVNLTMGMITPPVGGLLAVTSVVARVPLARLVGELWPFLGAQLAVLALLSVVPALSTFLPALFGYR